MPTCTKNAADPKENANRDEAFNFFGGDPVGFVKEISPVKSAGSKTPKTPKTPASSGGFDFFGAAGPGGFSVQNSSQGSSAFGTGFNFNTFNKSPEADETDDGQGFFRFNF